MSGWSLRMAAAALAALAVLGGAAYGAEVESGPWPAPVEGYVAPKGGEHPRLFFRKSDVPALKARAQTPEGKAMLARLCFLLEGKTGGKGDVFPTVFNTNPPVNTGAKGPGQLPVGAFTMGHGAGYAFMYQMTGEKKYAELAKQALEKMFSGTPDRDERYTWTSPGSGLRLGMMMTSVAMAYDMAYDGWEEDFRRKVVNEIQGYHHVCVNTGGYEGGKDGMKFEKVVNPYYPPGSNHYGALVGGGSTAILAIKGDPGADDKLLTKLQGDVEKNIIKVLTEGFGDHGMFAEGPGPSHMAANTSLVPALQAQRIAGGKDFISPRPNGAWLSLRWAFEIIPGKDGKPGYPCRNPSTYGTEYVKRDGTSDGGEFVQGFGAVTQEQLPALAWTYLNFVEPNEKNEYKDRLPDGGRSYDALTYPQRAVLAFINFPLGVQPKNPGEILGHSYCDTVHGYAAFRNQWKDADDILVTAYAKAGPRGYIRNNDVAVKVWGLGIRTTLPGLGGKVTGYTAGKDGSGTFAVDSGRMMLVDFSGASGAPALIAIVGSGMKPPGDAKGPDGATAHVTSLDVGDQHVLVMTLQKGAAPEVKAVDGKVVAGGQTLTVEEGKISAAK